MLKIWLVSVAILLTGCASMDQMVCLGTGTCTATGQHSPLPGPSLQLPQTLIMPSGTYIIVPNYSTGGISAVIKTSNAK